jgi:hypothetical protein
MAFGHHDLQTFPRQTPFCGDWSNRVYLNNPRNMEEPKHNTEPETLGKVAWKTLNRVDNFVFEKLVDIFRICCKAIL